MSEIFSEIKYGDKVKKSIFDIFKKHCSYVEYMGNDKESGGKLYSVVYQKQGLELKVV